MSICGFFNVRVNEVYFIVSVIMVYSWCKDKSSLLQTCPRKYLHRKEGLCDPSHNL